jgi:transcription elongation GreA/GreB family factor
LAKPGWSFAALDALAHNRRMSVAFTKESDSEAVAADLPDRPISAHANLVTKTGLAAIDAALGAARAATTSARAGGDISADRTAMARATRELRYWSARRASAQLVEPGLGDTVTFGRTVTIARDDGRAQSWRITGEDEADPAQGTIAYVAPLARALIGKSVGDTVRFGDHDLDITGVA